MISKGFQEEEIFIGTIPAGKTAEGQFVYNGPNSDIDEISLGCGSCTSLLGREEKDGKTFIKFKYTDSHVDNAGARDKYPNGIINVTKNITVWFKDGNKRYIQEGSNTKVNTNKERTTLTYRVDISLNV